MKSKLIDIYLSIGENKAKFGLLSGILRSKPAAFIVCLRRKRKTTLIVLWKYSSGIFSIISSVNVIFSLLRVLIVSRLLSRFVGEFCGWLSSTVLICSSFGFLPFLISRIERSTLVKKRKEIK